MAYEELKQEIERLTGVPANLLTGETAEENINQAEALLAYKRRLEASRPKSTKEQFGEWFNAQLGRDSLQDGTNDTTAAIRWGEAETVPLYPDTKDGGTKSLGLAPDDRPNWEQFAEIVRRETDLDPR